MNATNCWSWNVLIIFMVWIGHVFKLWRYLSPKQCVCAFRFAECSNPHSLPMCCRKAEAFDQPSKLCKHYSHSCQTAKQLMCIVLLELLHPMARRMLFDNLLRLIMRCALILVLEYVNLYARGTYAWIGSGIYVGMWRPGSRTANWVL